MNNQEVMMIEARETLKNLITDLVRESWNATRFMEDGRRLDRQHVLWTLWADKQLTF